MKAELELLDAVSSARDQVRAHRAWRSGPERIYDLLQTATRLRAVEITAGVTSDLPWGASSPNSSSGPAHRSQRSNAHPNRARILAAAREELRNDPALIMASRVYDPEIGFLGCT